MSWVIGGGTLLGYGVMISDVRVSWLGNGYIQDCLQKIYPLSNSLFCGFCGSVKLGFLLLEDLRGFLNLSDEEVRGAAWYPDWVAENWLPRAKKIFAKAPKDEQDLRSEIILTGVSPDEVFGQIGAAKIYTAVLKSPDFALQIIKSGNEFLTIGGGCGVEIYKQQIEKIQVAIPANYGKILLGAISEVIRNNPQKNISKNLQIALIKKGQYSFGDNDTTIYYHNGEVVDIKIPFIAKSYPEFLELIKISGRTEKGAVC